MKNQKILIVLALFGLFCNILATDDEFYCKIEKTKNGAWQVCRRCNDINKDCDGTSQLNKCKCDNIKIPGEDGKSSTVGHEPLKLPGRKTHSKNFKTPFF